MLVVLDNDLMGSALAPSLKAVGPCMARQCPQTSWCVLLYCKLSIDLQLVTSHIHS